MQFANSFRSGMLAMLSCVALAGVALTLGAEAQNAPPKRVIFGVVPPADGESNNPNRDIAANDEYQLKPMYENLIGVETTSELFGGLRVSPGDPDESALYRGLVRDIEEGDAQPMPPVGVQRVDPEAVTLFYDWISALDP